MSLCDLGLCPSELSHGNVIAVVVHKAAFCSNNILYGLRPQSLVCSHWSPDYSQSELFVYMYISQQPESSVRQGFCSSINFWAP